MAVAYSTYVIFKTIKNVLLVPDRTRTCAVRRGVFAHTYEPQVIWGPPEADWLG